MRQQIDVKIQWFHVNDLILVFRLFDDINMT